MNTTDKGGLAGLQKEWREHFMDGVPCARKDGSAHTYNVLASCADALTPFIQERADLIAALEACEKEMRGCETLIQSETWRTAFSRAWGQAIAVLARSRV